MGQLLEEDLVFVREADRVLLERDAAVAPVRHGSCDSRVAAFWMNAVLPRKQGCTGKS